MQNKGFVKLIAVCLTVICCFYLMFTVKSRSFKGQVEEIAATQGQKAAEQYQDSVLQKDTFLLWSMKDVRELGLGFGLDLEGGMNVILEVGVPDVLKALSDHKEGTNDNFRKAIEEATQEAAKNGGDVVDMFIKNYTQLAGQGQLAAVFSTQQLRDKVNPKSTDAEVEKVLREEVTSSIENAYNILTNRIDQFGVAQPNIQRLEGQEGRIMVELPGVKEPERVRKLLQGSANLEFWECSLTEEAMPVLNQINRVLADENAIAQTEENVATDSATVAVAETDSTANDSVSLADALGTKTAEGTEAAKAAPAADNKQNTLFSLLSPGRLPGSSACVVGVAPKYNIDRINDMLATERVQNILRDNNMKLLWGVKVADGTDLFELYAIKISEQNGRAPLEGDVVSSANESYDRHKRPCVSMTMNADGARRWATLTKNNVNRPVAIVLDDRVYTAPNVTQEITGGQSEITGNFTPEETRDLVNVLKSGRMPAPAHIVSEEIVGPSLGAESINQGMWSCIIAFVILMLYMVLMYGFVPGMVANCALVLNLFFTVGVMASFQAALTMSGIAGMVLSLGMAVDANVLIYERTKEELKSGKRTREALASGYSNAFSAIFDSNLTSIITGIILALVATGSVRGFAITLIIGICISFFTAVFLTRIIYEGRMKKDKWLNLTFTTPLSSKFFQNTAFKFMNAWKKSYTIFGVLAIISIGFMVARGFSKSIDFTGGRNYVVQFEKDVNLDEARATLTAAFPESNTSVIALGTDGNKIRISTNYRINEEGMEVDNEIEEKLFETLQGANMLAADADFEVFRNGGNIISSQKVGPSVADSTTNKAILSIILSFVAIFIYILIRFRNVAFSVGAISALVLDIILILGMYAICWGWMPFSLEIDQVFIGAVLTAIGYSINDKVVVFDRIREFLGLHPNHDKKELFNTSLNTTLTRTINTSVSTFIVLAVIFCLGGDSIRSFAFAMILGVIFGTLSSIFIAAPTAYLTMGKKEAKKK
ncbi:MAG: protein translocase subunit SecDF [Bacteroidales bacterium]|nr:protein translocase subunit SecDF [Candidatus Physcousia equi]